MRVRFPELDPANGDQIMLGENLRVLREQAKNWRRLAAQIDDNDAVGILTLRLVRIENQIARLQAEILREAC
jgi:hypothetical protein